ncbi:lipopolysaccharide biosynthesis protein [Novosphingobium jiangmenense]|uniref:Oligosaccharide flippase family protein n=1 Tax=Novosphingobium jiangmenense TaxID=2791981 RepID=A0ABS0HLD3_9SPHN|nr:oligosaccharide flippase family protein [Novosphingobium jiangmenense]MBF9153049.1 oligosaccharide flippase family protein [Novosphingobium jiangmenense]
MRDRIAALMKRGIALDLLIGLSLKGSGAVASFGLNLLISRALGAEGVGAYQIALATATLLAVASTIGLDTVVLRSVAVAHRRGDTGMARAAIVRSIRVVATLGTVIGLAMAALAWPMTHLMMDRPELFLPVLIMALAVPMLALVRTISASIRATGSVLLSQSLDGISYTGLSLLVLGTLWLASGGVAVLAPEIVYTSACTLVMLFGLARIRTMTRGWPHGEQTVSLKSGLRIMVIYLAAFFCDWIAVVTLGTWHGPAEAGIYRVAVQFGLLFTLVRNSFDQMVGSHIAARYAEGQYRGMLAIARKTGMVGAALCLPLLLVILVVPQWLLGLFGPGFVRGAPALMILAVGQFIAVTVGPIGTVLDMAHREHIAMRIEIGVTVVTIALFLVLIPLFDLTGAAMAITIAIVGRAVALLLANRAFIRAMEQPRPNA